ncbi:MAG: rhomboid family intramembrane serine protease [Flavobacteriales bacterium]|nr:rhomboid family intramembrane serine protease [Flavobacteriales bacterium]
MNYIIYALIGITALISYKGFNDRNFFEKYMLRVGSIINGKEYIRMISSGFLHADWMHLFFNMFTLYFFGPEVLYFAGLGNFLLIYLGSLLFGNIISIYFNRTNWMYSAIGASGAVSGVIFSAIILYPSMSLYIIPIPFPIPGWLFGIGYVAYSIYGMKNTQGNIGHSAHLGGGISGILITLLLMPEVLVNSWLTILLILVPFVILLIIERKR